MAEEYELRQSRASTHFKFYSEKYLWGSTRSELLPDEKSVWVDFLCLASLNFGEVEIFSRDQIAGQLLIERELLDRSIKKFIEHEKVKRNYRKKEKKEIFKIVKWNQYQAPYLKKRVEKSSSYEQERRIGKSVADGAENRPTLHKIREENIKEEKSIPNHTTPNHSIEDDAEGKTFSQGKDSSTASAHNPDEPSMSHSASLSGAQESLINAVLSRLANIEGYPFDEGVDRPLLERKILQYPNANFSHRLCEDINMWLEHPRMMGENPREYLDEWFDEEIANCLED